MNTQHGIEDLIALSRRNELSAQGRRELESLVQSSREVRLLLEAGLEFDAASSIDPGDESRVERLAQCAVRSHNARPRTPTRAPALAMRLAAALFICAAAATGAWSAVGIVIHEKARIAYAPEAVW